MPISFTAIDFETANGSPASVCAVGLTKVVNGVIAERAGWLIRPPAGHDEFLPFNVRLHGISAAATEHAESWPAQWPHLLDFIGGDVLVAHNANFDLGVIAATCLATSNALGLAALETFHYFCSLKLARRVYDLPRYRLPVAAAAAGFTALEHHNPISDAEACAHIVIDAAKRLDAADIPTLATKSGLPLARLNLAAQREEADRLIAEATFPEPVAVDAQ